MIRSLSDADRNIGRLFGEGKQLPNPHLLMRLFIKREAVLSSRIEGTQATLGELLANDAGASVKKIVCVIDRKQGAEENITGAGQVFESIMTKEDLGITD